MRALHVAPRARRLRTMSRPDLVLSARRPPGSAFTFRLSEPVCRLGRDPTCDACLPDASVSAEHVRFEWREGGYVVIDCDSSHGTFLAGERLVPGQPVPISHADALTIGPYLVEIFLDDENGLTTGAADSDRLALALSAQQPLLKATGWRLCGRSGDAVGQVRAFEQAPVVVGAAGDLRIPRLAPRHLRVGVTHGQAWAEGIEGTFRLRGKDRTARTRLVAGDILTVDGLTFEISGPEATVVQRRRFSAFESFALAIAAIAAGVAIWALLHQ